MNDLLDAVLQVVALAILSLGGLAIKRLSDWLKLRADSEVRAYLLAGLDRAVEYGTAEFRRRSGAVGPSAAELARGYAQQQLPGALAHFQIETPGLDKMIRARMPRPPAGLVG